MVITPEQKAANLRLVLRDNSYETFKWGEWDCCQFACKLIELARGFNPAEEFNYMSEIGANNYIEHAGGLSAIAERFLGPPIPMTKLTVGDLVIADIPIAGEVLCALAHHSLACIMERGFVEFPTQYARHGWVL